MSYNSSCFLTTCFYTFIYIFQLLLDLLENYPGNLRKISLSENKVKKSTVAAIKDILRMNVTDDASIDISEDDFLSTTGSVVSTQRDDVTTTTNESETVEDEADVSETGTMKELELTDVEETMEATHVKPVDASREKKEDDDLGEELKEVPVYW